VALEFDEIIERVGATQLARMDQRHEKVTHFSPTQRPVEQRVLSIMETFP
jgi:hypothetical protein